VRVSTDAKFGDATFQAGAALFDSVTFAGEPDFTRATFQGQASFGNATFQGYGSFGNATFFGDAWFGHAIFEPGAEFSYATFQGDANFNGATFEGVAFGRTTFQSDVSFFSATFGRSHAGFGGATFQGNAWFGETTFLSAAGWGGATFAGHAGFGGASFSDDARFDECTFERARDLGPLVVRGALILDRTVFAQPIRIEASPRALSCSRAQFRHGGNILVEEAEITLDDADFAEPSMITGRREPLPDQQGGHSVSRGRSYLDSRPRLLSVRRAKLANLTVAGVDLRDCRFDGAHGLDRLRLEADCEFATTPGGWRSTRRAAIAEELEWRARHRKWDD
jgi:uncharacterized protein YjbI with pentapeptide repeats